MYIASPKRFFISERRSRILMFGVVVCACIFLSNFGCRTSSRQPLVLTTVSTLYGVGGQFGEPFGVAEYGGSVYVSDGLKGRIWRMTDDAEPAVFADGLDTPSAIAFDGNGSLIVADSGSNSIKKIDSAGKVSVIAGVEGKSGFADGDASMALFNGPIGVAVGSDGRVYVADTYNDRIRVIEKGKVLTLAGSSWGYADGTGANAKFHTPCGIAIWQDKLLVADTGNSRIRVVESDGRVWTLTGTGERRLSDGLLSQAAFVQPTAVAVDEFGSIFVADGNAIREIGLRAMPFVWTISGGERGLRDGQAARARFNRPSGIAFDGSGNLLVTDSDGSVVRRITADKTGHEITKDEVESLRDKPEDFRNLQPPRWPYNPPNATREIAGTLGEIRGEIPEATGAARFHNGLDIAGTYGEKARFIRDEKVLQPQAAGNFGDLRESLRMPTIGYIHVRLGRDSSNRPFGDTRFQFLAGPIGAMTGVRIPRGTTFKAGDAIGTLNAMNHVHVIAGRSGVEMNALDALVFPNLTDSRPPTIEEVSFFDESWREIATAKTKSRIMLAGKTRIVVRAFDQTDGNAERRRLGVYQVGYQVIKSDNSPVADTKWTIRFDRMLSPEAVKLVYAAGSKSGATGETIFNYIATNYIHGDDFREDFFDTASLENGIYTLRVFVADHSGNTANKDIPFEVMK